jgi:hypothetical protein
MKPTDAKHTPGPWRLLEDTHNRCTRLEVLGRNGDLIAEVNYARRVGPANAELIASAPTLLAEVERLRAALTSIANAGECGELSIATMGAVKATARDALK